MDTLFKAAIESHVSFVWTVYCDTQVESLLTVVLVAVEAVAVEVFVPVGRTL